MFMEYLDQMSEPVTSALSLSFTQKQGQYLAFIHTYTLLNRQAPAEADFQRFFLVTAPSVHQMIVALERHGLITRVPGQARSIKLLLPPEALPTLQPIKTSAARY
jgi:DNA-binding MarR family transcriptional regulator